MAVYGDAAYGAGVLLERLEAAGADICLLYTSDAADE